MSGREVALFSACAPGIEPALAQEARALPGVLGAEAQPGGVALRGPPSLIGEANLRLRSANRVLLRLGRFRARGFPQLVEAVAAVPWERYLRSAAIEPSVTCRRCRLYHSGAVAERLRAGVAARFGAQAAPGEPGPRVQLRGEGDEWELSLDTSGALLHRRGYRIEAGEAPLRESLAAGLLLLAGYEGGPLLDLCCGAGTLAIEAGLIRRRLAPGLLRRFAFEDWPDLERGSWERQREAARAEALPEPGEGEGPAVLGVDLDGEVLTRARGNAGRAGLGRTVRFRQGDLFEVASTAELRGAPSLWVVANPPYGRRLGRRDEQPAFYRRLGRHLRAHFAGSRAMILCGHRHGATSLGLGTPRLRAWNGGLPVPVVVAEL